MNEESLHFNPYCYAAYTGWFNDLLGDSLMGDYGNGTCPRPMHIEYRIGRLDYEGARYP